MKEDPRVPSLESNQQLLKEQLTSFSEASFTKLKRLAEQDVFLETKMDQLSSDMDAVLQVSVSRDEDGSVEFGYGCGVTGKYNFKRCS